jgi:plasmid stability protein
MSDILIRNVPDSLKLRLAAAAERAGRSVSDEAIEILTTSLGAAATERTVSAGERTSGNERSTEAAAANWRHSLGDSIRAILGEERFTEEELQAIADFRRDPIRREPPSSTSDHRRYQRRLGAAG